MRTAGVMGGGRTPSPDPGGGVGGLVVHLATRGRIRVRQDGRAARLDPGDFALVDARRPFEVDPATGHVTLPLSQVGPPLSAPPTAVRIDGASGAGAIASSVIRTLVAERSALDPATIERLRELVVGMISLALRDGTAPAPAPPPPVAGGRLVEAVQAEIERSLADPGLSRSIVAGRLAISPSYLDQLLAARGTSFGRALLEARLRRCHAELVSSSGSRRLVGEIAAEAGLADASYFARAYKRHYGVTPSQAREGRLPV